MTSKHICFHYQCQLVVLNISSAWQHKAEIDTNKNESFPSTSITTFFLFENLTPFVFLILICHQPSCEIISTQHLKTKSVCNLKNKCLYFPSELLSKLLILWFAHVILKGGTVKFWSTDALTLQNNKLSVAGHLGSPGHLFHDASVERWPWVVGIKVRKDH